MATKNDAVMAELMAKVAELEKQLAAKNSGVRAVTCKVSDKGGVSVYGLGRFPVTLYGEQWTRLFEHMDAIKAFIEAHKGELRTKDQELTPQQQALIDAKQKAYASKVTTMTAKAS